MTAQILTRRNCSAGVQTLDRAVPIEPECAIYERRRDPGIGPRLGFVMGERAAAGPLVGPAVFATVKRQIGVPAGCR